MGLATGGALLLWQFVNGYQSLAQTALRISFPLFMLGAFSLVFLASGVQMLAWAILMGEIGVHLPWRQVIRGYMMSFLPRYIPGTIWGYLGRNEWLYQAYQVPYSVSNLGSSLEILLSVMANIVIVGVYYLSAQSGLTQAALLIGLIILPMIIWGIVRRVAEWPLADHFLSPLFPSRLLIGANPVRMGYSLGLFLIHWLLNGCAVWMVFWAASPASVVLEGGVLLRFAASYNLAWLIGFMVVFAPAGIGFRELAMSSLLVTNLGLTGNHASGVSTLLRLVMITSELVWVLSGFAWGRAVKLIMPSSQLR